MEEGERERLERMLEAVTLAGNAGQVREEVAELRQLAMQARAVEATGTEAKLARLEDLLRNEGFFDRPDKRLLVFTEFRDTLDHLVGRLKDWGFAVGSIHGGMKPGSRDEPGTRLHSEQRFREGAIQVLVATEAARYVPFKLARSKTVSHPPAAPAGDDRDPAQRNRQATALEPAAWLHRHALTPFLEDARRGRLTEIGRVASHVELSLTELLQRADEEIGKADEDRDHGVPGAEGRLARAEQSRGDVFPEADTMMNNCFPPGDPQ